MTISNRDTIIIAVLVNIGLLAVLFMTALHVDEDPLFEPSENKTPLPAPIALEKPVEPLPVVAEAPKPPQPVVKTPVDEVDQVISNLASKPQKEESGFIDIVVKRGDALEKIARANGTTIKELKKINKLTNDTLTIGQTLKVPVSKAATEIAAVPEPDDGTFYVIKSGDNPWKIARRFHVKYDDILKLNDFNEEKARKLQPGDKIRVK